MTIERAGWAAAVGSTYAVTNGQHVLIGRYTVTLTGAVIEGVVAAAEPGKTGWGNGAPEFPLSWDESGKCKSTHGAGYDLVSMVRKGQK